MLLILFSIVLAVMGIVMPLGYVGRTMRHEVSMVVICAVFTSIACVMFGYGYAGFLDNIFF
jgi:hypothetical protein